MTSLLSLLKRYRDLLIVSLLLAYPLLSFLTRARRPRAPGLTDRIVLSLTSPVEKGLTWAVDGTVSLWQGYLALRGVEQQNRTLTEENSTLKGKLVELEELRAQNGRLLELVGYAKKAPGQKIPARVVGVNPVATLLSIRIDRGETDGVHAGMPVVTPEGVVGQVTRTSARFADVVLVEDPNSRVGVRVQRSRARATASGGGGQNPLKLDNALRTEDLTEGDEVVTSGADAVFPAGLAVGRLTNVHKKSSGMFQTAEILPSVNPSRVEEVLVLEPPSTPPPDEVLAPPPMSLAEAPPK